MSEETENEPRCFVLQIMLQESEGKTEEDFWEYVDEWIPCNHGNPDYEGEDAYYNEDEPCYMRSMSGSSGTEKQCWEYLRQNENWAEVKSADLKFLLNLIGSHFILDEEEDEVYQRLYREAYWWEEADARIAEYLESEEDEDAVETE